MKRRKIRYYLCHFNNEKRVWYFPDKNKWGEIDKLAELGCSYSNTAHYKTLKESKKEALKLKSIVGGRVKLTRDFIKNGQRWYQIYEY